MMAACSVAACASRTVRQRYCSGDGRYVRPVTAMQLVPTIEFWDRHPQDEIVKVMRIRLPVRLHREHTLEHCVDVDDNATVTGLIHAAN
jgi:hypothetical protein